MDKYRRISELIKGFQERKQSFFPARVVSVEGSTCTVQVDDIKISDVRLTPTTSDSGKDVALIVPALGSDVLVGSVTGGYDSLFIVSADKISKAIIRIESTSIELDKSGLVINGGANNGMVNIDALLSWMQAVYGDLQTLKSLLAVSPSKPVGSPLSILFNTTTANPTSLQLEDEKVKH